MAGLEGSFVLYGVMRRTNIVEYLILAFCFPDITFCLLHISNILKMTPNFTIINSEETRVKSIILFTKLI